MKQGGKIRLTQVKSLTGREKRVRASIAALGLGRIGRSREFNLTPALQGMIDSVKYLVRIEQL
ncbi:MAG: 50S ribosomal protein L30 [Oligoflexia bacterium]|nr:50S ribosomal protein L30 [Oligoflexia bacterium]